MFAFPFPDDLGLFKSSSSERFSLEELRKIDPLLTDSDSQLLEIRDSIYEFATIGFERWWTKRFGSKNPGRLFSENIDDDTLSKWKDPKKRE